MLSSLTVYQVNGLSSVEQFLFSVYSLYVYPIVLYLYYVKNKEKNASLCTFVLLLCSIIGSGAQTNTKSCANIWNSVQPNHPCDAFSNFPGQAKEK